MVCKRCHINVVTENHMADVVRFLHLFHAPLKLLPALIVFFLTLAFGCLALGSDSVVRGILTAVEEFLPLCCRVQIWHVGKLHWLSFHCSQFLDKMLYNESGVNIFFVCFFSLFFFLLLCLRYAHSAKVQTRKCFIQHM